MGNTIARFVATGLYAITPENADCLVGEAMLRTASQCIAIAAYGSPKAKVEGSNPFGSATLSFSETSS